jgi:NAD(P)H-dependent FMN reductase
MTTIIAGTNRQDNYTHLVAEYYEKALKARHQSPHYIDLRDLPAEFLHTDLYGARSDAMRATEELMRKTQRFIFVVPEYNGSFPGVLKAFIDAFDPAAIFYHKVAAVAGLSAGQFGNLRGLDHFSGVLNYLQITLLPYRVHIPTLNKKINNEGELLDEAARADIEEQLHRFEQFC